MSSVWREILLEFGGNAMLLLVLAFLSRELIKTWLAKDVSRFKAEMKNTANRELEHLKHDLRLKGDLSIEQLRSELQLRVTEHQVRFQNLHEKRGVIIAELYGLVVDATTLTQRFITQMGEQDRQKAYIETRESIIGLDQFFNRNRIYIPENVCTLVENLIAALQKPVVNVWVYTGIEYPNAQTLAERKEAFKSAYESLRNDIPGVRQALEDEFRNVLGVGRL